MPAYKHPQSTLHVAPQVAKKTALKEQGMSGGQQNKDPDVVTESATARAVASQLVGTKAAFNFGCTSVFNSAYSCKLHLYF